MKITVLGRWGAYPAPGEATSGYLLETEQHKILLDCGSGVLANLFQHVQINELDAVFITHFHHDHTADLGCLQYACRIAKGLNRRGRPLPIYANPYSSRFQQCTYGDFTVGHAVNPETQVHLEGLTASFAQTYHDEYNLAIRLEDQNKVVVYTGDLGPSTDLSSFASDSDMLVCETSLFEHEEGQFAGHMTTKETAMLAQDTRTKTLLLTHFPHVGDVSLMPIEASNYYKGRIEMAKIHRTYEV